MDARINVLWADGPGTILPDTTYYAEDHPQKADLLAKWRKTQEDLLAKFDFAEEEIKDLLDKVLELDAVFAQYVLSSEESSEYAKLYHPYKWDDFKALVPELPLADIFTKVNRSRTRPSHCARRAFFGRRLRISIHPLTGINSMLC